MALPKLSKHTFPSKILLFGEYSVINGSQALAIPFPNFFGSWEYNWNEDFNLQSLLTYTRELQVDWFDSSAFAQDLKKGLFFKSTIPMGYGLGSSGALCAGLFDRYGTKPERIEEIKTRLAKLEGFFHGSSSGVDPLVCYLQRPVLIQSKSKLEVLQFIPELADFEIFILNTKISRETDPLVNAYLTSIQDETFSNLVKSDLSNYVEESIQAYLANHSKQLLAGFTKISLFQFTYFQDMIPKEFFPIWKAGLDGHLFKLKLCGAGGGGFLLGITKSLEQLRDLYPEYQIIKV